MLKRILCSLLLLSFLSACVPSTPTVVSSPTETLTQTATPAIETEPANWWNEAVFYEIFVRSYYDTDGNGIGDFNGITQKLDYIQSLGANAIWLMPIHPSPSYHGYDVINYYNVNPDYGTMADFKNLLAEAHKRDIRIIIDLVLNHTSNQHPWFKEAEKDPNSPHRDWYIWSETDPGYQGPWGERVWHSSPNAFYYGIFVASMPDLNYNNPEVTKQMNKVAAFWLTDIGVDGFRMDAVKHLIEENTMQQNTPATHTWLKGFYTAYKQQNPQAYAVGELIGAGSSLIKSYTGDQLDQSFNFEMASGFVNSANGGANSGITSAFKFAMQDMPDYNFATFLTNHDQIRSMSTFNGNMDKAKVASFLMLTSPGTPFIYYGEEIGMQGKKPDEDLRLPMQWSNAENAGFSTGTPWRAPNKDYTTLNVTEQSDDLNSLLNHYRTLIQLRKEHPALQIGNATLLETGNPAVFALLRTSGDEKILILVNLGKTPISDYKLSLGESTLTDGTLTLTSLFGAAQAQPLEITSGKFNGYKPLNELAPYRTYLFDLK
jgi:alpha-amylase